LLARTASDADRCGGGDGRRRGGGDSFARRRCEPKTAAGLSRI
jgi:hypothetical protein